MEGCARDYHARRISGLNAVGTGRSLCNRFWSKQMDLDCRCASTKHIWLVMLGLVLAVTSAGFGTERPAGTYRSLAEALQHADVASTLVWKNSPRYATPAEALVTLAKSGDCP